MPFLQDLTNLFCRTLEIVLPLMEHPSEEFLATLEEDMITLTMRYGQLIVQACISCLGVIINDMTHNYKLAQDCFKKFFICLAQVSFHLSSFKISPQV